MGIAEDFEDFRNWDTSGDHAIQPVPYKTVKRQEIEDLSEELRIPYATAERQFLDAGYKIS